MRILMGESMGGAVALLLHRKKPEFWDGAVLIAPMCKIADDLRPHPMVISVLTKLCNFIPTWRIVPTQDIVDSAFRDPEVRKEIRNNPHCYKGKPRLQTAHQLMTVSMDLEQRLEEVFVLPPNLSLKNFEGLDLGKIDKTDDSGLASYVAGQVDQSLSWKDVKWLQTITHLPILLKGVLTAEDARLAVESGAAGIIVSNHGARQLDYAPATVMALEEVVEAVQGRLPVFLDGGIRRGTDVFKALALGASGVFIGRPVVFSLAVDGEAGVRKVLQMLHDEFELTMALSGCLSIKEISRSHITTPWDPLRITPRL